MVDDNKTPSKALNVGLWVVQALMALMFTGVGAWKTFGAIPDLAEALPWAGEMPGLVRFVGISELLGGIGMILPAATRIQPKLTGLAGVGLTLVMLLAIPFHAMRGELEAIPVVIVIGAMTAFVAWGRLRGAPISGRG